MKVIPVMDILAGQVVHGVRGEREFYKPVESVLTKSSFPLEIASVFKNKLGLDELYVADLDAIQGSSGNFRIIKEIKQVLSMKMILDPGIRAPKDLSQDVVALADGIILGTETLKSWQAVRDAIVLKGADNVIVSIDIKGPGLLCNFDGFSSAQELVREMRGRGVKNFLILDLDKVGTSQGPSQRTRELIAGSRDLDLYIITGGGINALEDVTALHELGVSAVLIATALHSGKISNRDLESIARL